MHEYRAPDVSASFIAPAKHYGSGHVLEKIEKSCPLKINEDILPQVVNGKEYSGNNVCRDAVLFSYTSKRNATEQNFLDNRGEKYSDSLHHVCIELEIVINSILIGI